MIKFLVLFILGFSVKMYSQNAIIDSLKQVLKTSKHDTAVLAALNELVETIADKEWEKYNEQMLSLAEKNLKNNINPSLKNIYLKYFANSINNIGVIYNDKGNTPKALEYYFKSLKIREAINDKRGMEESYSNIGVVYSSRGNSALALEYYNKGLKIGEEISDNFSTLSLNINIADLYYVIGDIPKALEYNLKSLKIYEGSSDKIGLSKCLEQIGEIYLSQKNNSTALEYFTKSLKIREEINYKIGISGSLSDIARCYLQKKDVKKSIEYFTKSLEIGEQIGDKSGVSNCLNSLGLIYLDQQNTPKALDHFIKSLKIAEEAQYKRGISNSLNNIGEAYYESGDLLKAIEYSQKSMRMAQELGFPGHIRQSAKLLSNIYKKQNKPKEAFEMYELYITMRDSLFNKENERKVSNMVAKYEIEKKEQQIELLSTQNKVQQLQITQNRYTLIGVSFVILLILLGGLFIIRQQRFNSQYKTMEIEQKLLRSQMNPHFFFNVLAAIQNLAINGSKKELVPSFISKFSGIMRQSLESTFNELDTIENEVEFLTNYLELQKLRSENRFSYEFEIDKNIETNEILIPGMILQPFIENSIEHGFSGIKYLGIIKIHFLKQEKNLIITLVDNGSGFKENEKHKTYPSRATQIIRDRLYLLNKKSKSKASFSLTSLSDGPGMKVEVSLPLIYKS